MPQALPFLSLGLGLWQTIQSQQMQQRALEAAKQPRLSLEAQASLRREGTAGIRSNLAQRGMLDSSLLPGGLASLERKIGEAAAAAGPMGNESQMLWEGAMGLGRGGSETLGNLAESYMLNRLFGQGAGRTPSPTWWSPMTTTPSTVPGPWHTPTGFDPTFWPWPYGG